MTLAEAEVKNSRKLIGGKIVGVFHDPDKEYWGIDVVIKGKTHSVWVNCDPEGNGPGHLEIES